VIFFCLLGLLPIWNSTPAHAIYNDVGVGWVHDIKRDRRVRLNDGGLWVHRLEWNSSASRTLIIGARKKFDLPSVYLGPLHGIDQLEVIPGAIDAVWQNDGRELVAKRQGGDLFAWAPKESQMSPIAGLPHQLRPICALVGGTGSDWIAVIAEPQCATFKGQLWLARLADHRVTEWKEVPKDAAASWVGMRWREGFLFYMVKHGEKSVVYTLRSFDPRTGDNRSVWTATYEGFHLGGFDISRDGKWMIVAGATGARGEQSGVWVISLVTSSRRILRTGSIGSPTWVE
jgi:hypothetical protein